MTKEEIDAIVDGITERVLRLPPRAVKYLEPFRNYVCPPVAVGYGPDYCILLVQIQANGSLVIQLKSPDSEVLWQQVMVP